MLSMFFNANTKHFEYSSPLLLEDITYDDFGFEKGTRESTWIQETLNCLQTALQEELGEKKLMSKKRKEKIQIAHRAIILNRLYDFMFFCLENNIDFYPDPCPAVSIPIRAALENNEFFIFNISAHTSRYPIDDACTKLAIGGNRIPVILGPMIYQDYDKETGEITGWSVQAVPLNLKSVQQQIEQHIVARARERVLPERTREEFEQELQVTLVKDSDWIRENPNRWDAIQRESRYRKVANASLRM